MPMPSDKQKLHDKIVIILTSKCLLSGNKAGKLIITTYKVYANSRNTINMFTFLNELDLLNSILH